MEPKNNLEPKSFNKEESIWFHKFFILVKIRWSELLLEFGWYLKQLVATLKPKQAVFDYEITLIGDLQNLWLIIKLVRIT